MRLFYEEWNELAICQTLSCKLKQAASDRMPANMANDSHLPLSGKLDSPANKDDIEFCQSLTSKLKPDDSNTLHLPSYAFCRRLPQDTGQEDQPFPDGSADTGTDAT